jgi:C4-dicarboxylate transporter DctQ subunit
MSKIWDLFEEQAGGLFLLVAVLLVAGQIVGRSLFGFGVSGLYEIATYCAVYSVFFTTSLAIKQNAHIRIDILNAIVSPGKAFLLELFAMVVLAVVSGFIAYSGWLVVEESHMLNEQTLGTISMPVWAIQLILPISGGLMFMRSVQRFAYLVKQGPANFRHLPGEQEIA